MNMFKVGDMVRAKDNYGEIAKGDVGVVKTIRGDGFFWPYYVDYGHGGIELDNSTINGVPVLGLCPSSSIEIELVEAAA